MDKYENIKIIGKGSYGDVFLVKNKSSNQLFVLKKIFLRQATTREAEAAQQEVNLLAQLNHPNIVDFVESFTIKEEECLCIVMGYCEGGDLFTRLQTQGKKYLPEKQIVEWFIQIVMGLKYLHDKKIMHRDIKTQNIFLTSQNIIKLGDLGIARALDGTREMARTIVGTPYYMSPELYANKPYDFKTDIWALGCVLYEMLSLKHAFDAKEMGALILKVSRGTIPPIPSQYSPWLQDLIRVLLNRLPNKRPSCSSILKNPNISRAMQQKVKELEESRTPVKAEKIAEDDKESIKM